jgi:hypothetical protein
MSFPLVRNVSVKPRWTVAIGYAEDGVCGQLHTPAALPPWNDTGPIVQEAGWGPERIWTGAESRAFRWNLIPEPSIP